jgi:hypothetical protein
VLDEGRVTVVTTVFDAVPVSIAKMPEDTVTPLLMAIALTALFSAVLVALVVMAFWLWPEPERLIA